MIRIDNQHPTLKLRLCDDGWCEDASREPGEGPRFQNSASVCIRGGTFRGGEFWGGTFWGGAFWGGAFRGGAFWGGTFWGGTFRFALTAQRSDGYVFTVNDDGAKIAAGCRYFTWAEAREHWRATRAGTPLGDETFRILDFLEAQARAYYPGAF